MEKTTEITHKLTLAPDSLGSEIEDVIMNKLKEKYIGTCNKKYGYILDIEKINWYTSEVISPVNFCPVIKASFMVKNLKPEVGMRLEGMVSNLREICILLEIQEKIKVLVNSAELKKSGFTYDKVGVSYKGRTGTIHTGDDVSFEIFAVQEEGFLCLGKDVKLIKEEAITRKTTKKATVRKAKINN